MRVSHVLYVYLFCRFPATQSKEIIDIADVNIIVFHNSLTRFFNDGTHYP